MEHRQETNLGIKTPTCYFLERLRGRGEEHLVDDLLVHRGELREFPRHREHHVKVWDRQKLRLACLQPLSSSMTLATRTVTIPARVIGRHLVPTTVATIDVATV